MHVSACASIIHAFVHFPRITMSPFMLKHVHDLNLGTIDTRSIFVVRFYNYVLQIDKKTLVEHYNLVHTVQPHCLTITRKKCVI